jgi:hypothetical protein
MTRLLRRLTLALLVVFTGAIGLIRAQPYDDGGLETLLIPPENCPRPCWQGIRPGRTLTQEALALLKAHPWIDRVELVTNDMYEIRWSGRQPAMIDADYHGVLVTRGDFVTQVRVPVRASFGDVWLRFDQPQYGGMSRMFSRPIAYLTHYADAGFTVRTPVHCPLRIQTFWQEQAYVIYGAVNVLFDDYELNDWARGQWCHFEAHP